MSELPVAAPVIAAAGPRSGRRIARTVLALLGCLGAPILAITFEALWTTVIKLTTATKNSDYYDLLTRGTEAQNTLLFIVLLLGFGLPVVLFALVAFSRPRLDAGLGRFFDWPRAIVIGVEAACIAVVITLAFATHPPLWQPITVTAAMVVLTAIAVVLAPRFVVKAVDLTALTLPDWTPKSTKGRSWFWWVVVGATVVATVLALLGLHPLTTSGREHPLFGVMVAITLGLSVGGFACMVGYAVTVSGLKMRMLGPENGRGKTSRAIYLARNVELTEVEREYARRVALMAKLGLPWLLGFELLFGAGQVFEQAALITGPDSPGPEVLIIVAAAFLIATVAVAYAINRARAFLARNGAPTPTVPAA